MSVSAVNRRSSPLASVRASMVVSLSTSDAGVSALSLGICVLLVAVVMLSSSSSEDVER